MVSTVALDIGNAVTAADTKNKSSNEFSKAFNKAREADKSVFSSKDNMENQDKVDSETRNYIKKAFEKISTTKKAVTQLEEDEANQMPENIIELAILNNKLVNDIKETLCENLNITNEELEALMNEYNIDGNDLANEKGIIDLLSSMNDGKSMLELLTDPEFADMMKNITNQVRVITEQFTKDAGMTLNQMQELIDNMKMSKDAINNIISENEITSEEKTNNISSLENAQSSNEELASDDTAELAAKENKSGESAYAESTDNEIDVKTSKLDIKTEISNDDNKGNDNSFSNDLLNRLTQSINDSIDSSDSTKATDIVKQVIDDIRLNIRQEVTSMEVQLNPENLGKVTLNISTKHGDVSAQLIVQNEIVKEALESQIGQVKEALSEQGIKIEAVEITIASHEFEQNLEQNNENNEQEQRNTKHIFTQEELDEINMTASKISDLQEEMMKENGSTVTYLA